MNETEERIKILKKWKEKLKVLYKNMKKAPPVTKVEDSNSVSNREDEVNFGSSS